MPEHPSEHRPSDDSPDSDSSGASSKAAFLGGLLAFVALVALSVAGVGHARAIAGAANTQYWIVVVALAGGLGFVTRALARTPARTKGGELARRVAIPLAALWLAVFLWETIAVGSGAFTGPFELAWAAWKG